MTFQQVKELFTKLTDNQKLALLCELLVEGVVDQDSDIQCLEEYVKACEKHVEEAEAYLPTETPDEEEEVPVDDEPLGDEDAS
jgi:hypothetical protein